MIKNYNAEKIYTYSFKALLISDNIFYKILNEKNNYTLFCNNNIIDSYTTIYCPNNLNLRPSVST